jgi:hypothetical protein
MLYVLPHAHGGLEWGAVLDVDYHQDAHAPKHPLVKPEQSVLRPDGLGESPAL